MKDVFNRLLGPSPRKLTKKWKPRGYDYRNLTQKHINALRDGAVPAGKQLNPYGKFGNCYRSRHRLGDLDHLAWRPLSMKRKRLKLKANKAIALEQHELQRLARESATLAMDTLREIAGNPRSPEASRIAASAVILDRAYGKAAQTSITANVTNNGKTKELTQDELDRRVNTTLKRVEELTNRTSKTGTGEKRPPNLHKLN